MPPDEKPPMPAQPTTMAIEKPPAWAIAIAEAQAAGFASVNDKVDSLSSSVEVLQHDAKDTRLRLGRMEREVDEVKGRQTDNSMRVKAESSANLQQDAALAQVFVKVGAIEQKVDAHGAALAANTETTNDIKKALSGFLKEHPSIVASIVTLLTTAIGAATAWFAAKGH